MEFIHNTTLVHLRIRQWSGKIKAQKTDFTLGEGGKLPSSKVLNLGQKQVHPPEAFKVFNNLRASAERACYQVGTKFMGGFAILDEHLDELTSSLEEIEKEYNQAIQTFRNTFDANKQDWKNNNAEDAHIFNLLPELVDVESKFSFGFGCYKINPKDGFEPDMEDVANQVLHEISVSCKQLAERFIKRKTNTSGNSIKKLIAPIMAKLENLSFGNGRILSVLSEFNDLHDAIDDGRILKTDGVFKNVITFLTLCSDESRLETIMNGDFSVASLFTVKQPQTLGSLLEEGLSENITEIGCESQDDFQESKATACGAFF